jgi:plastocyanin
MMQRTIISRSAAICLAVALAAGATPAGALISRASQARHVVAQATGPAPRTWHVIAGFTQTLPAGNNSTEAVNQFYPRKLTIHAGDKVTWTVNSANEPHIIAFAPDPMLRHLEDPNVQFTPMTVNGKQQLVLNPVVWFPSSPSPLVMTDSGTNKTLVNCGQVGPAGAPTPQSCTIAFPNVGTFAYDCLLHSGIPGFGDMDGTITVEPLPAPSHHWTVLAGTGTPTDAIDGYYPDHLTVHVGDSVSWKSGGVYFHTVTFGLDPRKAQAIIPVGKGANGPILGVNPQAATPSIPAGGVYMGGFANSGLNLIGNYLNAPGQKFSKQPFTLIFGKAGTYTYFCFIHGPSMAGTITVLPAGQ